jgi:hypothetical protein
MYKVHINHAELHIGKTRDGSANYTVLHYENFPWDILYNQLKSAPGRTIYHVFGPEPAVVFNDLKQHFTLIEAAGGIVRNAGGAILMIYRLGKWDLPKGKMESGENPMETAIREVQEECGAGALRITDDNPAVTYHTYELAGERILKKTWWYMMEAGEIENLIPQTEEGITGVVWVKDKDDLHNKMRNTFQNIRDLLSGDLQPFGN